MAATLTITKTEYTLNGANLDREERWAMTTTRILGGTINTDIVKHTTIVLEKTFKTAKAAYAFLTDDTVDSLGLVWNATLATYSTEYVEYTIEVCKA